MDGRGHAISGQEKALPRKGFKQSKFAAFCERHRIAVIVAVIMICLLPLLGLIALKNRHAHAQTINYTSPVVYPSPQGYGAGNWTDAYTKARALVANMTLEEMNNITIGVIDGSTGCVGVSGSAPSVNFPGLCLHDAGNGVRNTDGVSGFASGLHIGATWNASLAYQRAQYMGAEFKRKGVNVGTFSHWCTTLTTSEKCADPSALALGPVVGPIGRIAEGGRNWEAFASGTCCNLEIVLNVC